MIKHKVLGGLTNIGGLEDGDFWFGDTTYAVYIQSEKLCEPSEYSLQKAVEFFSDWTKNIELAIHYVRAAVAANPQKFGVNAEEVASLISGNFIEVPELIIRTNGQVEVRFTEGVLPICDSFGLVVEFENGLPSHIEDVSQSTIAD